MSSPDYGDGVRITESKGWYFTVASIPAKTEDFKGSHLSYAFKTVIQC
jgi:hypothetical protein